MNVEALRRVYFIVASRRNALEEGRAMSYTARMIIEHQIVTDAEGKPTAALIPWDAFEVMRDRLENGTDEMTDEFKAELNQRVENLRNGTTKAIPHDELMADLQSTIADSEPKKSA